MTPDPESVREALADYRRLLDNYRGAESDHERSLNENWNWRDVAMAKENREESRFELCDWLDRCGSYLETAARAWLAQQDGETIE